MQKYLSLTGHVYTPAYLTAGASWKRLPPDVQKTLAETAKEVEPDILKLAAKLDGELIGKMKTSGIAVNEADKPAFVAASKAVYEEFAKEVPTGKQLIDKSLSLAKGSWNFETGRPAVQAQHFPLTSRSAATIAMQARRST